MEISFGLVLDLVDQAIPFKSKLNILATNAKILNRRSHNIRAGLCVYIEYFDRSLETVAQNIFGIVRIKGEKSTFTAGRSRPTCRSNPAAIQFPTGDGDRRLVLLASVNTIAKLIIDVDAI